MPVKSQGPRLVVERSLFLGLDVGKVNDPAALCVLQRKRVFTPGPFEPADPGAREWIQSYGIRHLERLPLGTSYPRVVDRVRSVIEALRANAEDLAELVVDVTGVGRPVFDMLRDAGLSIRVTGVNYTGGNSSTLGLAGIWNVPKRDLVACLVLLFQNSLLRIAEKLPDAGLLVNELVNFRQTLSAAGRDSYANDGREAKSDDYVNAAALAAWRAVLRSPRELGVGNPLL